jgi:hypothetical protein
MSRSQNARLLDLLRANGERGVTPREALDEIGTMRLAARIRELREAGHDIESRTAVTAGGARVSRYVLLPAMRLWP